MSWFFQQALKPVGPFTEEEMRTRFSAGEISPEDLIWKDGADNWQAAALWPEFKGFYWPAWQEAGMIADDAVEWIVLEKTSQGPRTTGPWSLQQIREALAEGRIRSDDHLWKKGMTGWARISSRPEKLISDGPEIPSPV